MANSYNHVVLVGRLGCDPVLKNSQKGMAIADFRIASNYVRNGQEETSWIPIRVFGAQAESCGRYLNKGRNVLIEGRIDIQTYQDSVDSTKYTSVFKVIADRVLFLDRADNNQNQHKR